MTAEKKKSNTKLRRERELRGWSQKRLGFELNISTEMISRWENGWKVPSPYYQSKLCDIFGKNAEELGFLQDDSGTGPIALAESSGTVKQEYREGEALHGSIAAQEYERFEFPVFPAFQGGTHYFSRAASHRIQNDKETLDLFGTLTETCLKLSEGSQLATAERVLWSYLPDVEIAAQTPSMHQRFAAHIVSQGYLIAASLVGHHNDLQARYRFSKLAWRYGTLAEDRTLQVAALRQLAVTFDYLERPQNVLQTYLQALPYLNDVPPRLRACIYAALSGVYAQLKQKQETARFIGLAYEQFPETTSDEPHFLRLINANYHTILLWDGLNHLELDQPRKAEEIFTKLDVLTPTHQIPERIRIELLNYRSKALAAVKDMEQACTYLEVAIQASMKIQSARRLQESFTIFQQIRDQWPQEPRVQQVGDLFFTPSHQSS